MIEFFALVVVYCLLLLLRWWLASRAKKRIVKLQVQPVDVLRRQLIRMVAGDRALAERLVRLVKEKNPGQDENWYWEKTISDLEKDRR